ncbi:MAG: CDP-glucose 4,6-dehydratase [Chitinophagales bacterium]|nr:CDP-glucose 4,6-dehydratase [Chitinophagales bacterium]MDW8418784.1 CDP-glucose 4,6-dehydratase [Chitinophagales bacterium]
MENFYRTFERKRVFLTGHTGFKGSWMLLWLHHLGATVKGYSLAPENDNDLYHIIRGDTLCTSVIADVRDKERLADELIRYEPDFVFHLAAQPLVRQSYEMPAETFDINVMGTVYVLDALRMLQKKCVCVIITTDKVYENKEWSYPYRENDRLGGFDPYSASKAAAEIVVSAYRNSFFHAARYAQHQKSVATARAGNVIGGGDRSKDRIIPDVVRALQNGEPVVVRNPQSVRPWQHVLEPLSGYLTLASKMYACPDKFNEAWNFGPLPERDVSVEALVNMAIKSWGSGSYTVSQQSSQLHETGVLKLDISKAVAQLGWLPKLTVAQAVAWTIEGYLAEDLPQKMVEQIKTYQTL